MKTPVVARFISLLVVVPMLSGQMLRDNVPLRHWPAPLYWQADLAELHPLAATPTQPSPLTFIAMTPCRVVDTRVGFGFSGAFGPPSLVGGMSRTFPLQSSTTCSIPATALAYSLNFTVVPPGPLDYLTAYPTGQTLPPVSTLNSLQGFIVANAAIVPAGAGGSIDVYASNNTDLIIDINGYYAAPTDLNGNTAIGAGTLANNTTGNFNTATGQGALDSNTTGNANAAFGWQALFSNTTGGSNTATGQGALYFNTTGGDNTATGASALASNTTGTSNTAIGVAALSSNTTGDNNTATGLSGLSSNTTGGENTAMGNYALFSNTSGGNNTATGYGALSHNTTGSGNTAIGFEALIGSTNLSTTGSNNIAIGVYAAFNVSNGNSNNIHIGTRGASGDNGTIRIGGNTNLGDPDTQTQFFASGIRGTTTANNDSVPVVIDSAGQLGTVSSSRRFKEDIQDMADASSGLMRLRPVTFRYQKPFTDGSKQFNTASLPKKSPKSTPAS